MEEFPHKIWAHPDFLEQYHAAVARVKEKNPDAVIPSHLDPRGLAHVLKALEKLEAEEKIHEEEVVLEPIHEEGHEAI